MSKNLKTSYDVEHQVESFFTGTQLVFEPSGEHFYCSYASVVNKVSVDDGQVKAQISTKNEGDNVIRFALSPDGNLIIIAYYSGLITKYNLADEINEREFKSIHSAPITQLKINPAGTLLATASSDGTVKLWNLENHYCSHNLKGVNGVISAVEFYDRNDSELLICSAGDDCIHIFDLATSKRIAKLSKHCSTITDLKVSPDGKQLISVGRDKIAVLWSLDRDESGKIGQVVRTIPIYECVESVVIVEPNLLNQILNHDFDDSRLLFATIGEEGQIKFWDAQSGSMVITQNQEPLCKDRSPSSACFQLVARPNTNQICAASTERDLFFYELPELRLTQQLQGHLDEILSACWFAKDQYLAIACNSNDLKILEVATSRCHHLKGHSDIVVCVKPLPCDPLCIVSSSKDCSVIVWRFDPATMSAQIVHRASGHTHAVYSLGVSPCEATFFSGGEDTTIKKWTIPTNKRSDKESSLIAAHTIKAHDARIDSIDVSPNDQLVATGSRDKTAKIFSTSSLQIVATLKGHRRGVNAVQFSPVDQVIVTAADSSLRMWNLQDSTCVKTFQGHDCAVLNFSFLSTGLQMISIGSDGNAKLWNCKLNECIKTIDAHSGNAWSLSLTSDGCKMVTGGDDEKLVIWRDTTEEEREEKLANLQSQVVQEQDFMNYINKKKWRKALKMALKMENQGKTLTVMREIVLEPDGPMELEEIIAKRSLDQINFIIECCVSWTSSARNSALGQLVLNIILRRFDNQQLLKLTSFSSSLDQLKVLTEKSFNRYERLVQEATFVDFLWSSMRIQ